jgi:hypothetical protein
MLAFNPEDRPDIPLLIRMISKVERWTLSPEEVLQAHPAARHAYEVAVSDP